MHALTGQLSRGDECGVSSGTFEGPGLSEGRGGLELGNFWGVLFKKSVSELPTANTPPNSGDHLSTFCNVSTVHALTGQLLRTNECGAPSGTFGGRGQSEEQGNVELGNVLGVFSPPTMSILESGKELLSFAIDATVTTESVVGAQVTTIPGVCSERAEPERG